MFAENVARLIKFIFSTGYKCTFGEAYRPKETAAIYAKQGRGIAKSLHCERMAIDINLFNKDGIYLKETAFYKPFGKYWETLDKNNVWIGGGDGGHFQMNIL